MKRTAIILTALLCMASRHPDRMIRSDLALNVSFSRGDASDRSIYTHTGTLNSGAAVTAGNRWVTLDGTDDNVSYPDHDSFSPTVGGGTDRAMSVSCWVKLTSATDAYRTAVSKLTTTGNQFEWQLLASNNSSSAKGVSIALYANDGSSAITRAQFAKTITAGSWFHICGTYAGTKSATGIKVYINGARVDDTAAETTTYAGATNGTAPVRVGLHTTNSNPLAGDVDDVRIYSRELSAAEVAAIYSSGRE